MLRTGQYQKPHAGVPQISSVCAIGNSSAFHQASGLATSAKSSFACSRVSLRQGGWKKQDRSHLAPGFTHVTWSKKQDAENATVDDRESKVAGEARKGDQGGHPGAVWALYAAYLVWLFLLPYAPGDPAWNIQPGTIEEVTDLSLNFFFILPALNSLGVHVMEAPSLHPTTEALFNFVNSWSLMFGPLIVLDARRRMGPPTEEKSAQLWSAQMFLTNVFLIPYMALRLRNSDPAQGRDGEVTANGPMGRLAESLFSGRKAVGATGVVVAVVSIYWFFLGRSGEGYGDDIASRVEFFIDYISTNRLAYAFVVDIVLYSIFQAWLVRENMAAAQGNKPTSILQALSLVPCIGLGFFLLI